jgi:hypothetical protein
MRWQASDDDARHAARMAAFRAKGFETARSFNRTRTKGELEHIFRPLCKHDVLHEIDAWLKTL